MRRVPHAKGEAGRGKGKVSVTAAEWPRLRQKVLNRDKYTCRYCGFRAGKFQRVHFKLGQQAAPTLDNLATACVFCEQCFELESVANMDSGLLIWLPELSQAELNHFARALYVARQQEDKDPELARRAQAAIDQLISRRSEAKRRLGTDEPILLATAMTEQLNDTAYDARTERLDGIRLLPFGRRLVVNDDGQQDQFPRILSYWMSREGPFGQYKTEDWAKLLPATA